MDRSHGFGSTTINFCPIKTRFRCGSTSVMFNLANNRNSLARSTKSTRSWLIPLSLLVNTRFQILFHSPPGVLFTFPSRYLCAIGHQGVFSLRGWSPCIPTGFHVPCGTRLEWHTFTSHTGLLPPVVDCSKSFCSLHMPYLKLGSTPFARRYLEYRGFFLFLGVLRCFSSPGIPFIRYEFTHEC